MGERKTPTEALADARADKQHAEAEAIARSERDAAYPAIAEARLKELAKAIEAEVPPDLRLEIVYGSGGRLGNRGLKNLSMKLFDSERVISQGAISVSRDETVECEVFPPDRDERPSRKLVVDMPFASFTEHDAVDVLTDMIIFYGV